MFACRTGGGLPSGGRGRPAVGRGRLLGGSEIFPKGEREIGGEAFGKRESGASFGKVKFGEGEGKRKRWQKERA